jgi:NAD(P)-dependent dehydrogenase (short-subunit alcohol dehydrogenase family)
VGDARVAIVTGAGTGIGSDAARLLAEKGVAVALVGRRRHTLEQIAAEIRDSGKQAVVVPADLADPEAPARVVAATLDALGRLDILVNNAARIRNGPIDAHAREEFDLHYAVNVRAPFFLVQASLPALRQASDPAIVNISSSVGSMVKPGTMLYGSSKAALEYLTRAMAYELATDGIRVNCIAPGPVDTPIHATYSNDLEATYADLARRIPLQRMGKPRDIATWVWLLVAPETGWTTGNVIHADGGQVLGLPESAGG